jgi:hypothetical protein
VSTLTFHQCQRSVRPASRARHTGKPSQVTDLWGLAQVQSLGGHHYVHMFINLFFWELHVTFLKMKSEAFKSNQSMKLGLKPITTQAA